jgi:hypothetical protein
MVRRCDAMVFDLDYHRRMRRGLAYVRCSNCETQYSYNAWRELEPVGTDGTRAVLMRRCICGLAIGVSTRGPGIFGRIIQRIFRGAE